MIEQIPSNVSFINKLDWGVFFYWLHKMRLSILNLVNFIQKKASSQYSI